MNRTANLILAAPLAMFLGACVTVADDRPTREAQESDQPAQVYSEAELDQMLAPIALYPDALLSQILMAAIHPLEVVQAARWSRAHPGLEGEPAVQAAAGEDWDPSVKSLVAFPQVLAMMDEKLEWTEDLGEAFDTQPTQVMDSVQRLRRVAYDAGNLRSGAHYRVERRGEDIVILPATDEVVYVPYYDPRVVYGSWWWAAYPPVYWSPWPGYRAYAGTGFHWSAGIFVGPSFFFGFWDWPHRHVIVVNKFVHGPKFHTHRHKALRHDPHHRQRFKHRDVVKRQFFAPPHVRLHPGARHDLDDGRHKLHGGRKFEGRTGKHHGPSRRELHSNPAAPQRGIPRLGPRPDRLTQWPGFSSQQRVMPTPRLRLQEGSPHRGISRGHRRDLPAAPSQPRFRVNAPQIRTAPRVHTQMRGAARSSASAPRAQGSTGRALGGMRPFNGFRR